MKLSSGHESHYLEGYSEVNGKLTVQFPLQLVRDTQERGKSTDYVLREYSYHLKDLKKQVSSDRECTQLL